MSWGIEKRKMVEAGKTGRCQEKGFACWSKECLPLSCALEEESLKCSPENVMDPITFV